MSRSKPQPEFLPGGVRIVEDLGTTVDEVERLGFKISVHWDGSLAISERDAYAYTRRQQTVLEQGTRQWADTLTAQWEWFEEKRRVYTEAFHAAERGRGTPKAYHEGTEAGAAAVRRWAKHNPPEDVGLAAGLVNDTSTTVTGSDDSYDPDHINWAPMVGVDGAA